MDVCDVINDVRDCRVVHCGITESEHITLAELASRFGLIFTPDTYREISKFQAAAVAKGVLHCDLAYDSEIMPETAAQALANCFLGYFDEEDTHYYTNGDYYVADESSHGWNPATTATFDTGILVIGKLKAGCLWVEDEDSTLQYRARVAMQHNKSTTCVKTTSHHCV